MKQCVIRDGWLVLLEYMYNNTKNEVPPVQDSNTETTEEERESGGGR